MKSVNIFVAFVARQLVQIREGGWPELRQKLKLVFPIIIRFPLWLLELPFALVIVFLVRVMRPFCLVRFRRFMDKRLGHFAGNTELYLCERDAGVNMPKNTFLDIWYHNWFPTTTPCNEQLSQMWGRILNIGPRHLSGLVDRINSFIPNGHAHRIGEGNHDRDVYNLLDRFPPHLNFLPGEERRGKAGLRALGIPADAPFICLNVRDSAYLDGQDPRSKSRGNWSYHNYRDCSIGNYVLAAQALANRGYYVVRMGALVKEEMNIAHPMIIDYATNGMRSDFMDIYLGAKCEFCISNGTGFDAVPRIFRRPILYVDHVSLGDLHTDSSKYLATTKKHWLRDKSRFMTFREIFESGAACFFSSQQYKDMGIDLIESAPEEIAAVVLEMEARLTGSWQPGEEDEELQRRFWEIFPKTGCHREIRSRIAVVFLRQNKAWLE